MLMQPTIEKLVAMKLAGMAEALHRQLEDPEMATSVLKTASVYWSINNGPGARIKRSPAASRMPG